MRLLASCVVELGLLGSNSV